MNHLYEKSIEKNNSISILRGIGYFFIAFFIGNVVGLLLVPPYASEKFTNYKIGKIEIAALFLFTSYMFIGRRFFPRYWLSIPVWLAHTFSLIIWTLILWDRC